MAERQAGNVFCPTGQYQLGHSDLKHQVVFIIFGCTCNSTCKAQDLIKLIMHQKVFLCSERSECSFSARSSDALPLLGMRKSAGRPGRKVSLATVTQPLDDASISLNNGELLYRSLKIARSPAAWSGPTNTTPRTCPGIHWTHTLKEHRWWRARCRCRQWPVHTYMYSLSNELLLAT